MNHWAICLISGKKKIFFLGKKNSWWSWDFFVYDWRNCRDVNVIENRLIFIVWITRLKL